jgi:hypothetical protein
MDAKRLAIISGIIIISLSVLTVLFSSNIVINTEKQLIPTLIPEWLIGDLILLIISGLAIFFILKNEKKPLVIIFEMICFCFLYAAIYENFATMIGLYRYGESLLMILNVPLTIPLIEYILVYTTLRLTNYMKIPNWIKPFLAGLSGIFFDFTLDPLATKQLFSTKEGIIGRWTWFINTGDVSIYSEPVYNFTGWFLLCGLAAATLLIGRHYYKQSKYSTKVAWIYPPLTMIAALLLLISPLSRFILWLEPLFTKGSVAEWIMLGVHIVTPLILTSIYWKGKMLSKISLAKEYLLLIMFIGIHLINILFSIIEGYYEIIWLQTLFALAHTAMLLIPYYLSRKNKDKEMDSI